MKTVSSLLLVVLSFSVLAGPDDKSSEALKLTEEQRNQVKTIMQERHQLMQQAKQEIQQQTEAQMAEVLEPEQMELWLKHQEKRQKAMQKIKKKIKHKQQHRKHHKHISEEIQKS